MIKFVTVVSIIEHTTKDLKSEPSTSQLLAACGKKEIYDRCPTLTDLGYSAQRGWMWVQVGSEGP